MLDNVFLCPHQSAKNFPFYLHGCLYIIDFPSGRAFYQYLIGAPVEQIEDESSQICLEQLQENELTFLQLNANSSDCSLNKPIALYFITNLGTVQINSCTFRIISQLVQSFG